MSGPVPEPPSAQSPFARRRRYRPRQGVVHLVGGRYPPFFARMGSCDGPNSFDRLRLCASFGRSLQVAVSPCWKLALPDVISAVFVRSPGPVPRRVSGDLDPFARPSSSVGTQVPRQSFGLAPVSTGSAREMFPAWQLPQGVGFRGCSHSLMFRLPHSLGPQVAPTAVIHRAAGPFTSRNEHVVTRLDESRTNMNCDIATYLKRTN